MVLVINKEEDKQEEIETFTTMDKEEENTSMHEITNQGPDTGDLAYFSAHTENKVWDLIMQNPRRLISLEEVTRELVIEDDHPFMRQLPTTGGEISTIDFVRNYAEYIGVDSDAVYTEINVEVDCEVNCDMKIDFIDSASREMIHFHRAIEERHIELATQEAEEDMHVPPLHWDTPTGIKRLQKSLSNAIIQGSP